MGSTSEVIFEQLTSLVGKREELTLPVLLGMAACVDGGSSLAVYSAGRAGTAALAAVRSGQTTNHKLLDFVYAAKWQAVRTIAAELDKDLPGDCDNEHLKTIHDIAKAQSKNTPGKSSDARSTKVARTSVVQRLKDATTNLTGGDPSLNKTEFTEHDQKLLACLDVFISRESQHQAAPGQEAAEALYQATAKLAGEEMLDELFAIANVQQETGGVPAFIERFHDQQKGWAITYRTFLKARLCDPKHGQEAKRVLLSFGAETLQVAMSTQIAVQQVEKRAQQIIETLDDVADDISRIMTLLIPTIPLDPTGSANRVSGRQREQFNKLVFISQQTKFCGRDVEMELLDQFMQAQDKFKWWQIAGLGGQGKSRLALELVQAYGEDWHAGFLLSSDLSSIDWYKVTFNRPTLIVIDYVAAPQKAQAAATAVKTLAAKQDLDYPVRILLVERAGYDLENVTAALWFQAFAMAGKHTDITNTANSTQALMLDDMAKPAMLAIAQSWRRSQEQPELTEDQGNKLLELMRRESPSGEARLRGWRPLLAMIFADLVAEDAEMSLNQALKLTLQEEKNTHWRDDQNQPIAISYAAKNLSCLATMIGRLDPGHDALKREDGNFYQVKDNETMTQAWIGLGRRLTNLADDDPDRDPPALRAREPDLLGEYMLHWFLGAEIRNGNHARAEALIDDAWKIDPDATWGFLIRLAEDFRDLDIEPLFRVLAAMPPPKEFLQKIPVPELAAIASYYGLSGVFTVELNEPLPLTNAGHGNFPLNFAAQEGHDEVVKALLKADGIEVNQTFKKNGAFPLLMAAQNGHDEVVKALLEAEGIKVNQTDEKIGTFPLLMAAQNGHDEVVKALLATEAEVNKDNPKNGAFPLLIAATKGHDEVVKALLKADGIEVNQTDKKDGTFPLLMAAQNGHDEVVNALIEARAEVNQTDKKDGTFPLLMAAQNGHDEVVKALLKADGIEVNQTDKKDGAFPLLMAAQNGHDEVVKALLEAEGIEVNQTDKKDGTFPLLMAAQNGHDEVVKALLKTDGIKVNQTNEENGTFPLLMAAQNGHVEVVNALIEARAEVNQTDEKDGTFPLLMAAQNGHDEVVKALLKADRIEVNQTDKKDGTFPLLMAAQNGHDEVVNALIEARAEVNQTDKKDGTFPLLMAAQNGHDEVVKALLKADGIEVNQTFKKNGAFPLLMAAQNGHDEVVKALLEAEGIEVNQTDKKDGTFPLLMAALQGHDVVVRALLNTKGINPRHVFKARTEELRKFDGMTAIDLAILFSGVVPEKYQPVIELLQEAGCTPNQPLLERFSSGG